MSIRTYLISDSITFRKTKEDFGGLSNMCAGFSLNVHDIIIPTAEHLYQACRFPDYPDLQWAIINEISPMKAKWIGRANLHLTRKDWDQVKFKVMQWVLEVKLSQNWNSFSGLLNSTGSKSIVELTPKDKVWGAVKHNDVCIGVNALGRLLMHVRETYAKPNRHQHCVFSLEIGNFKFMDREIGLICNENEFSMVDSIANSHEAAHA